jgi:hypothetical protein
MPHPLGGRARLSLRGFGYLSGPVLKDNYSSNPPLSQSEAARP